MESLLLSILGDIIRFEDGKSYINRLQITKNKNGESFREYGLSESIKRFYYFLYLNGVNQDLTNSKYSLNTMLIFGTLKGIINKKDDFTETCKEEYSKIYKKSKTSLIKNSIPFDYLNSFSKLDNENYKPIYDISKNDSNVLPRIIPIALLYSKKDKATRKICVESVIKNILLTHYNVKCYLSAVTFALFISYGINNIDVRKWANNIVDYLKSKEFEDIIKDLDLYDDNFIIEKEQYITIWNEYISLYLKIHLELKNDYYFINQISPFFRFQRLFTLSDNNDIYAYGLRGDDSILIAYDSLLFCTRSWDKIILMGTLGPTNNSVMGTICGALFGAKYKFESVWIDKHLKADWFKKTLKLGKSLGL